MTAMDSTFAALLARMQELRDLSGVIGLATWDQETYLPRKAEAARGEQLSTLQGLYHERLVDPRLGELMANAKPESDDQRAMVLRLAEERDRQLKVPGRLVRELAQVQSQGLAAWKRAREAKDTTLFFPVLARLLELRREQADALGHDGERYDALLEAYEPGMRVARLLPVLDALASKLTPMVEAVTRRPPPVDPFHGKTFDAEAQWRFTMTLLPALGFDLEAGRQDRSVHPFTGGTHPYDVRLTTRINPATPLPAIFGTIHEAGHGLYEQGFAPPHHRTPLAAAPSMGLHESQSRLWENVVGRSRGFWAHFYPALQRAFPAELGSTSLDHFVGAVNRVERSLIRVEADELTYNLHIVLRTQLELALLRGQLEVKDLEAAWNEKSRALLGRTPQHPAEGVLQDIHWSSGELGYFPTYALGNLYAASLFAAARRQLPGLEDAIARGELSVLREWLREQVHAQGYRLRAEALVTQVTGRGLTDEDFLAAMRARHQL